MNVERSDWFAPCFVCQVDNDTIWNESHTSTASRMAAGSVVELAHRVAKGELKVRNSNTSVQKMSTWKHFYIFHNISLSHKQLYPLHPLLVLLLLTVIQSLGYTYRKTKLKNTTNWAYLELVVFIPNISVYIVYTYWHITQYTPEMTQGHVEKEMKTWSIHTSVCSICSTFVVSRVQ